MSRFTERLITVQNEVAGARAEAAAKVAQAKSDLLGQHPTSIHPNVFE